MPYIITTANRRGSDEQPWFTTSRRAVATLGEVERAIESALDAYYESRDDYSAADHREYRRLLESTWTWDDPGGTVGPLPDGTMIEVERVSWPELGERAGLGYAHRARGGQTIDAYNAAQAPRAR
jgi:hypothetical protein